jgi:ureidoacrylate peracid hydrolase
MHHVSIRKHIVDRVLARRGKFHWFEQLDPERSALLVIDMQNTFCEPGSPAEVPAARSIVAPINALTLGLRALGVPVFWVLHANTQLADRDDWKIFFNHVVADEVRARTLQSLTPGRQTVWHELQTAPQDLTVFKNRYSALIAGASTLEPMLRNFGIDTLLIAGTKTNICCESTARDAMMLDFKVVMLSDCCAALSDEEHLATLETFIQQFGDVMTGNEALDALKARHPSSQ